MHPLRNASFALTLALVAGVAHGGTLALEALGTGPVPVPGIGNAELSGIVWEGGNRFLSVDDGAPRMFPLDVTLDDATSAIRRVEAGEYVKLEGAQDLEGITRRPDGRTVLVTDEALGEIREYDAVSGKLLRTMPPPRPFPGRMKKNLGLESLTSAPDGTTWIANEGPLRNDGNGPNAMQGGWVRLQRLDASLAPTGQYAYRTEPGLGWVGVSDLLATPEAELLVLERSLTGGGFAARIFQVDISHATDVTAFEKLRNRTDFHPVEKHLLFERSGGFQNFEGMALGPALASGGQLVLLVSDGNGRRQPTLLALRLTRKPPEAAARP